MLDRLALAQPAARVLTTRPAVRGVALRAALIFGACLLGLALLEAATRIVFDRNGMHYGLEMWKYARQIKRPSANALMSHEHTPGSEAVLMGVKVTINSEGLRDRQYALGRPPNVFRILVLGDSVTLGWGVPADKSYPKVLERLLNDGRPTSGGPQFEVINAGVGNYNTVQEVAYFKERGIGFAPNMVLLGFFINDAETTQRRDEGLLSGHSYLYVLASSGWDAFQRKLGWKETYTNYYLRLYSARETGWQACRRALADLADVCKRRGIRLQWILIPELHAAGRDYPFERVHTLVGEVARDNGVPAIDLRRAFEGVDPRGLWVSPGDAHPNELAHRIIARQVYQAVSVLITRSGQARRDVQ